MKATDFLRKGADLLEERGKQYDQPDGERSMGKAVSAFNTVTGRDLRESEGWLLLQILKDVRQWQNPDEYHADSAEDCVSYAALKAEALASESAAGYVDRHDTFGKPLPLEPAADIDDDSPRMRAIGQNGNDGLHYDADRPSWDDAPDWAMWLIKENAKDGEYVWVSAISESAQAQDDKYGTYQLAEDWHRFFTVLEARPSKDATQ